MIDLAAPPPNPACQASKPRCPPEGLYFWICALWGVIIRRPSQRFQTQARTNVVDNDSEAPPNRPRRWHRQGPPGLHRLRGGWDIGRIYETRGGPESLRWFWSMTVNGPMTHSDRVATLEDR